MAEKIKRPSYNPAEMCCDCHRMDENIKRICKKTCDGKDGITPHIGENGNWWIGEKDTGIHAQGTPGPAGPKGDKGDPGSSNLKGLHMQTMHSQNVEINFTVPFDTVIEDNSDGDIVYDSEGKVFVLKGPAIYKIDWQVNYVDSGNHVVFSLMYENSTQIPFVSPANNTQLSGTALLKAYQEIGVLSVLVNSTLITLIDAAVQANIVITKLN